MFQSVRVSAPVYGMGANLLRNVEDVDMKSIFEFFGIVAILLCILAAFSLAELAYGGTLDDVLNYQYQYSTADQDCTIDFATNSGLLGYSGFGIVQIECTRRNGVKYTDNGYLTLWQLSGDIVKVDSQQYAVGQSGTIYPICGEPIKRKD